MPVYYQLWKHFHCTASKAVPIGFPRRSTQRTTTPCTVCFRSDLGVCDGNDVTCHALYRTCAHRMSTRFIHMLYIVCTRARESCMRLGVPSSSSCWRWKFGARVSARKCDACSGAHLCCAVCTPYRGGIWSKRIWAMNTLLVLMGLRAGRCVCVVVFCK